jgi:hypothetical protein
VGNFRAFYKKHRDSLFAYLMRSTGDYYLSGDILQESFTRYLEKYGDEGLNSALLYTIARNAVVDGHRRQGRDTVLFDEQDHSWHNPESHMMVREDYRRVLAAMQALEQENVVKLTRAMLQSKFNEQQIQLSHALMIEAKNSGMPVQPLMNKAFEGMAKSVSPPLIVGAMETVQSRNAFSYQRAARFAKNKSHTANLGRALSAALAAGFSKEDADKITNMLQQRAKSMKTDQAYSLALECFKTARDISRLGVSSQSVTNMLAGALNKGFNHQDMHAMRSAFMTQARQSQPQNLVRSYSAAIQEDKGFQEGRGDGEGSGGAGHGAAGSGGSGSGPGSGGPGSGSNQ